jgi:hypothetical protein
VRAGTVIFRESRSGLRYEIPKDDIDVIISEFGIPVRFRVAEDAPGSPTATRGAVVAETGPRAQGLAGRYRIRFGAAKAIGSPECTQDWQSTATTEDEAIVRHLPGADTLTIAFVGGDAFPSNIDREGWFASTFRILPDQARSMTALTTRLSGRFISTNQFALTVNIVFYRRMRTGADVTCNVMIPGDGRREDRK